MKIENILQNNIFNREEISYLLSLNDESDLYTLYGKADDVRKEYCGGDVHLRGIIEFSNNCEQDCIYCGLRNSNLSLDRYRMNADEIVSTAGHIKNAGIETELISIPGTGHEFRGTEGYHTEHGEFARLKMVEWFEKQLNQ